MLLARGTQAPRAIHQLSSHHYDGCGAARGRCGRLLGHLLRFSTAITFILVQNFAALRKILRNQTSQSELQIQLSVQER
jgi:hypothetical protein